MFRNQGHQMPIHVGKYQGADLEARIGKRLGRHHADRVGSVPEVGEELVKLRLDEYGQQSRWKMCCVWSSTAM